MNAYSESKIENQKSQRPLLSKALLGNALFSGTSGLALALASGAIASFLGLETPAILTGIGIVLILYAPFLYWLAGRDKPDRRLVWLVIELDILWVIGSLVLVFTGLVPALTVPGKWAIAIVADVVAVFAIVQYLGLRKM